MRDSNLFLRLLFLATLTPMLYSCNLRVSVRNQGAPPMSPASPPETVTPFPSATSTFTPPPSDTPQPTPTLTLFFAPTFTPTRQWSACPGIVVTQTDLGPLADGTLAVGPNDKFLVYVTSGGIVYGSRIGEPYLYTLYNLAREHIFTVFNLGVAPDFKISFSDGDPVYKLILVERTYDQKRPYDLPARLTH
jgi:hypothetical protein